jgi:CRP-like cAMP-binding protein
MARGESRTAAEDLWGDELPTIKACATSRQFRQGELIFSEGDVADYVYFIESGKVLIFIKKFTAEEEIKTLGPGDYFGEMAVFYKDRRTASTRALTDVSLLSVDKSTFLTLLKKERAIADKINTILARRNEELLLKESVIDSTGMKGRHFHVSIKGDPSLRESAFTRERFLNIVDEVMPQLQPRLEDLLINCGVYELMVHLNSGEVHAASVFNPYQDKIDLIRRLYDVIAADQRFTGLPDHFRKICTAFYGNWEALTPDEIRTALSRLSMLRNIPNFYLRNFTISVALDAIRLQFNCDGTHIVSAADYERFVEENVTLV